MSKFSSEVDFIAAILTSGAVCTIDDVRQMPDYNGIASLPALARLTAFCEQHSILVSPPLTEGELGDLRTFTRKPGEDEFNAAFDRALERGEGIVVEFKQTLFVNVRRLEQGDAPENVRDQKMLHEVVKTVTAFMNAEGGTLLIGVDDSSQIYGVENEYPLIRGQRKDADGWEQLFWSTLQNYLDEFGRCRGCISGTMLRRDGHDVFVVIVKRLGARICICRDDEREQVYVRNGNQSKKLKLREIEDLIIERINRA